MSTLNVIYNALECKTPERVPSMLLGADFSFMKQFYNGPGFLYDEIKQFKKDHIPMSCPTHIGLAISFGVDLAWYLSLGQPIWLDHLDTFASMCGGLFKPFVNNDGVPQWWYITHGLTSKELIKSYLEMNIRYPKILFRMQKKMVRKCEKKYNLIVACGMNGMWESLREGIGFGQIAKFWRKDRKFLHEINDFYCDYTIEGVKNLVKLTKPRVVMIGDDYGFNLGLQMSLEMWRELIKPALTKIVKITHDGGAKFVLHSCGNIGRLFQDFVEIGIDGVQSLKPKNNDLLLLKRKYGDKIALLGTIDDTDMLKNSKPKQVRRSVLQSIKQLGPNGYIPGATNGLLDQPVENVYEMFEAIKEYKI